MTRVAITGASRGIGRAAAQLLARRGAELALVGRPSPGLDETCEALATGGARVHRVDCDLEAAPDRIAQATETILERMGPPDAVIHNAAVIERAPVVGLSAEVWDRHMAVNVRAPFVMTRALLPKMLERGRGRHVYVSSISATLGTAGASAYCASKWALTGFVKSLAEEISGTGVTAVAVLPGSVDTEMLKGSGFEPRMTAEDVARTLVFYALDAPDAHNGAIVEMFGV